MKKISLRGLLACLFLSCTFGVSAAPWPASLADDEANDAVNQGIDAANDGEDAAATARHDEDASDLSGAVFDGTPTSGTVQDPTTLSPLGTRVTPNDDSPDEE